MKLNSSRETLSCDIMLESWSYKLISSMDISILLDSLQLSIIQVLRELNMYEVLINDKTKKVPPAEGDPRTLVQI